MLTVKLAAARKKRSHFHPPELVAVLPKKTGAIRVTSTACPLNCAHCNGHYLKGMRPVETISNLQRNHWNSLLISGACDLQGEVPLIHQLPKLRELSQTYQLNLHPGLIWDAEKARQLAEVATVFSSDFITDARVSQGVYGLPYEPADYFASLQLLQRYAPVVPHICLGLAGPELRSEYQAVQKLAEAGFTQVVFLIFRPTKGTPLAHRKEPEPETIGRFLAEVGESFPHLELILGCMRPGGKHRVKTDEYALLAGVNTIVQPTPTLRTRAEKLGLEVVAYDQCCSLRRMEP